MEHIHVILKYIFGRELYLLLTSFAMLRSFAMSGLARTVQ